MGGGARRGTAAFGRGKRRRLAACLAASCVLVASGACHDDDPPCLPAYTCPDGASPYCDHVQGAMRSFLGQYACDGMQIAHGETLARLLSGGAFGGGSMTWEDACTVEMVLDEYAATGDAAFLPIVRAYKGFNALDDYGGGDPALGSLQPRNGFYDDKLWWALAFIRAYETLPEHDPAYLRDAEVVFQDVCTQWNTVPGCSGGLPQKAGTYVNTITNALFFQTAVKLHVDDPIDAAGAGSVTGNRPACAGAVPWTAYAGPRATAPGGTDPSGAMSHQFENDYLGWALAEYEWFALGPLPGASLTSEETLALGPLPDGIDSSCAPVKGQGNEWSYNSGPILGALLDLSNLPAESLPDPPDVILETAWRVAGAAMMYFGSGTALSEVGVPSCGDNPDCPQFKGIFARYLGRLAYGSVPSPFTAQAQGFLANSANAIWSHRTSGATVPANCRTFFLGPFFCDETHDATSLPLDWTTASEPKDRAYQPAMTSALDGLIAAIPAPGPVLAPPLARAR